MFVLRPRLHRILDESATRPLTVLVAPAGSGKTATLAEWATAATDREVRWYDARSMDSAIGLATALVSCVRTAEPTGPVHVQDVLQALSNGSGEPDVLVIDDAHQLSPPAWTLLEAVLTAVPDRVHVMLATRRDAPLAMVPLELTDAVTTVRVDALRFTDAEAAALVTAHAPDATSEDVLTLQARALGWAAALVVGARTLGGATDRLTTRAGLARGPHSKTPPPNPAASTWTRG